ncbi:hypothetical protein BFJ68_g16420 [Fusarium oxysporum]|uniref:Glycoside hydrolase family 3 N-terminal domain-containing protein n=1 Tax=Fusarium oxysporum TaxID=5507 RepID=A0A420PDH7_FUSOX|nr:hypothetical protein BFJ68_g16420 [Fusarium oxysporum]
MNGTNGANASALSGDLYRAAGQLLFVGWNGSEVTPHMRRLIEEYHVGAIVLTAGNLISAQHTINLIHELQVIAYHAKHSESLLIAIDQEGGSANSLVDDELICRFPSAMGIAATGSLDLAHQTSKATAECARACGINLIVGPVLDTLLDTEPQTLGVRSVGDDYQEVSNFAIAAMNGINDAGLAACGKHFPTCGTLDVFGSRSDVPVITKSLDELKSAALVPFRNAIATGRLESVLVSGCGISSSFMDIPHAFLSSRVVDGFLRHELGFDGVVISECLETRPLIEDVGVRNGIVMALRAGCDLVMLCQSPDAQLEAIQGLALGISNGVITMSRLNESMSRIRRMKSKCTSWQAALNPPGIPALIARKPEYSALSTHAYEQSISIFRDRDALIPISKSMQPGEELLLLTPLLMPQSALTVSQAKAPSNKYTKTRDQNGACGGVANQIIEMANEDVFGELGRSLARMRSAKILHTSYTANGVQPVHEKLIDRASTIIVVTANASQNLYQTTFAKDIQEMCQMLSVQGHRKSIIVVAVSSPYDFPFDTSIGTYVCTFDFTGNAMRALARVLCGACVSHGSLPGSLRKRGGET